MAELTQLETKLAEVMGLAQAAKDSTAKVKKLVGAMNEQAGDPRIGQLVEWARPIQERHFEDTRAASLKLAQAEDALAAS